MIVKIIKYNIGDTVWIMHHNKCCQCTVMRICYTKDFAYEGILYVLKDPDDTLTTSYSEDEIFPDKDSLLLSL